jgi:hypothetical protein
MNKNRLFKQQKEQISGCLFCLSLHSEMLKNITFLFLIASAIGCYSQQTVNQHIESELSKLYKEPYAKKKEIKLDGKKYRIYNNYVTLGAGKAYNGGFDDVLFTTAADLNFHLQKTKFQAGGLLQGRSFGNNQLIQFHFCTGYKKESYKYFWAVYGGVAYTDGYNPVTIQDMNHNDSTTILRHFNNYGLYTAAQLFYKLKFDYGIGLTAFASYNKIQSVVGARIELFFSGAYRGTIRHKDEE